MNLNKLIYYNIYNELFYLMYVMNLTTLQLDLFMKMYFDKCYKCQCTLVDTRYPMFSNG